MNVKLVGLVHGAGYNRHVSLYIDEVPFNTGPFEFINLIKYAKCVLTDSFHCCVFSILFEREFLRSVVLRIPILCQPMIG